MNDLISRQAAIDAADMADYPGLSIEDVDKVTGEVVKALKELPSAQPERKKGKWIYGESEAGNDGYYCSECGNFVPWIYGEYDIDFIKEFLFCNKCGSRMRGAK